MKTIQELATEVLNQFETKKRDNDENFECLKDGSAEWMRDLVREAHDSSLPNDMTYSFITEALQALSDNEDLDDAMISLEPDVYNRDLLNWLASSISRAEIVNEAVEEYGLSSKNFDLMQVIGMGQVKEKIEVFGVVLNQLQDHLDSLESESA